MSQYSEMMGSFIRTGSYPLEANYIFPTEASLREFYSDELNATTLHKGLLRIVEDDGDGNQALYWVQGDELQLTKLVTSNSVQGLIKELITLNTKLDQEIQDRKNNVRDIYGTDDSSEITYNTLLSISLAIKSLMDRLDPDETELTNIKDIVKALAGTDQDDISSYLLTLPYSNLTQLSEALNKFLNTSDKDSELINTLPDLQSFLEGYTDSDKLKEVLELLVDDLMGNPSPTTTFRTFRGIEDFVRAAKSQQENSSRNLQTELDWTQIGVGLNSDGSFSPDQDTTFLKGATSVVNALKILDGLINDAINNTNIQVADTPTLDLTLDKQASSTTVSGRVKISTAEGNGIISKEDGLYSKLEADIDKGILTLKVNNSVIFQKSLGITSIINNAYYDQSQEQLIIECQLADGTTNTVKVPVGSLIEEWEVDNSGNSDTIQLTRTRVVNGADKLSADVRLSTDSSNILVKDNNTLLVKGTTDNFSHTDGRKVNVVLDALSTQVTSLDNSLDQEIRDRTSSESAIKNELDSKAPISNPIFKGLVQAEDLIDPEDSSQRLATTAWVTGAISRAMTNIKINDNANDLSDIKLSVSDAGLSAKFVIGEYD